MAICALLTFLHATMFSMKFSFHSIFLRFQYKKQKDNNDFYDEKNIIFSPPTNTSLSKSPLVCMCNIVHDIEMYMKKGRNSISRLCLCVQMENVFEKWYLITHVHPTDTRQWRENTNLGPIEMLLCASLIWYRSVLEYGRVDIFLFFACYYITLHEIVISRTNISKENWILFF